MENKIRKTLEKRLGTKIIYFGMQDHPDWQAFYKMETNKRADLLPSCLHDVHPVFQLFSSVNDKYFQKFLRYSLPVFEEALKGRINKILKKDSKKREYEIRQVFDIANKELPCFLFLNDIDHLKIEYWNNGETLFEVLNRIKRHYISGLKEPMVFYQLEKKPKSEKELEEENYTKFLFAISRDVRQKLNKFEDKEVINTFIEILKQESFEEQEVTLSSLLIDGKFNVHLPDYGTSIKLTPLEKTAYFLFLNHPEGIMFCDLPDFRNEVAEIYKHVNKRLSLRNHEKSIDKLVDPFSNSMSEKLSKVRNSFLIHHDESIVEPYIISGKRGGPKKVKVARELVKIENDGKFWRF